MHQHQTASRVKSPARGGLVLFILLALLSGCATAPQTQQLLASPDKKLPHQTELSNTPFFPQERYQCGPAALATALNHSGVTIEPETLVGEIYIPSRLGSLQIEILASTRHHGRLPYHIQPNLKSLFTEVAAGNPVLVLQNLGLSWAPQWHYAVVVGFDLAQRHVILRSGLEPRHITTMDTFELTWARSNYWGIVIMPPDQLPATADADSYLRTVVNLENTKQWSVAQGAYRTALTRWPNNFIAQMGLGNSAYQLGDLEAAAQAFGAAVTNHPDASAAHNNLAQVLLELGKLVEAETHAQRAVKLAVKTGDPHLTSYRATLSEIQQKNH